MTGEQTPIIAAVGDVILERRPGADAVAAVGGLVSGNELVVCSFEGVLSERGEPLAKSVTVRTPIAVATDLRSAGIGVAALANNHTADFGPEALVDTVAELAAVGIAAPGAGGDLVAAAAPALLSVAGLRVAVLSATCVFPRGTEATERRPGVAPLRINYAGEMDEALAAEQPGMAPHVRTWTDPVDEERLLGAVGGARRDADVVLVVIHWGVHPPWRADAYGPLQDYQRPLGRALIDAGADAVLGNHAVELQGIEIYRERPIAYCLGVVWYDGIGDYPWVGREAIVLRLRWRAGRAPDVEVVPLRMDEDGVPHRDGVGQTIELMRARSAPFGTEIIADEERWLVRPAAE